MTARPRSGPAEDGIELVSVYRVPTRAPALLYELMRERDPSVNISHRAMPSWDAHLRFIAGRPYAAWYLIRAAGAYVGAIYLSRMDEVGVFILAAHRGKGYGVRAIRALMQKHARARYLANINPRNTRSFALFERLGFATIQHTLEYRPAEGDAHDRV